MAWHDLRNLRLVARKGLQYYFWFERWLRMPPANHTDTNSAPPVDDKVSKGGPPPPHWPDGPEPNRIAALQFVPAYLVAGAVLFFFLWMVASFLLPPGASRLWGELLGHAIFAVSAFVPAIAIAKVEQRPFGAYGLPVRAAFGKSFWMGALWGVIALSALVAALRLLGHLDFVAVSLHGVRALKFAAFWAVFFLVVALFEEFAFRGYAFFSLTRAVGFWPAALLLSALFGGIHAFNAGETWHGVLGAAAIGLFFCFTLRRTGNLWFAVGLHASWDWAQSFLCGVPDSGALEPGHLMRTSIHGANWITGGSVGPEGSILLIFLIVAMWIIFDRMYPAKRS
jgi:CAAX protease family protein